MQCDKSGQFLFQIKPDLFPYGYLTDLENQVWMLYLKDKEQERQANGKQ